ncbi:hypothetical protein PCANC_04195 [Puccinia coronata f. sp. avenae]|uniref:Uncharacterized protein n=1 Tax=Puccinia coronata f. sp. avenae TaxID=200324 RepID=A0A2N5VX89_9BASI|nr:hypothetical protein PCANC_04195 [Puccinia coronata f. sp. avenae]
MLSTASRPIGGKDNLPKRHTAWPNLQPQNIEAARGSNPHQKHQAAGLGAPLLCPCTDTETKDGPGAELSPTPGRSYVAPLRPVAALGRYQAACARSSSGPACDDSGYRRITVAHPFRPGDPWRRRGGMGTGSGTVSQVAPLVRFTQSCDQAGTAASSGRALSASRYLLAEGWLLGELVCTSLYQLDDALFLAKPVQDFMTCSARNHAWPSRYKLVPEAMFPRREGASRYLLAEERRLGQLVQACHQLAGGNDVAPPPLR